MNNKKLKVVFMPISITEGMAGTKRLQNFAVNLLKKDVEVANIIIYQKEKPVINNSIINIKNQKAIRFYYKNPLTWLNYFFSTINTLINFKSTKKINILYNYGYPDIKNIFYILFAKIAGYKIVFDIVEDNFTVFDFKNIVTKIRNKSSLFFFNRIDLLSNGIIGISFHLIEKLKGVIKDKKKLIHLPISVNHNDILKLENKRNTKYLKIFYGGSFADKDGLEYLLKAFDNVANNYSNTQLILTGKASGKDAKKLEKLLGEMNNREKVKLLGYLSYKDYLIELHSSDILCMTRKNSSFANAGFPFKLGEMLLTGKPVLATKVGDVPKYLDNDSSMLVDPNSVESIERGLIQLIENKKLRKKIGENGKKVVIKYFDAKVLSEKLYHFLIEL